LVYSCSTGEILGPEEDLTGVIVDDDSATMELDASLNKALKIKQKKKKLPALNDLADRIVVQSDDIRDDDIDHGQRIRLNATSEFCRSLGEIPTYGQAGNREEEEDELMVGLG
jgi:U4/U6.U5 tri-snRNP-associated protein 1